MINGMEFVSFSLRVVYICFIVIKTNNKLKYKVVCEYKHGEEFGKGTIYYSL